MSPYSPPQKPFLDIVYRDDFILLANKQPGLLTVPGRGEDKKDCLISRLQTTNPTALSVHRLDMATSGLVLFALNKHIHRKLSRAFEERAIGKQYVAWIAGQPNASSGTINLPLIADWQNRPLQKVDLKLGKASVTHWIILKKETSRTLVSLTPETGRTHQLRVHLKEMGHPILGDPLYAPIDVQSMAPRLMLHANFLEFEHPATGDLFSYTCDAKFNSI